MLLKLRFKKATLGAAVTLAVALLPVGAWAQAPAPAGPHRAVNFGAFNLKWLKARAAVVMDAESGQLLYTYHPNDQRPLASLTKLLTALVYVEQRPNWDSTVAMTSTDEVGGGRLRVDEGAQVSKRDLFYCALVGSANNTAVAMSRTTDLTKEQFLQRMNTLALEVGMASTTIVDPSGIEVENLSTALDVARLGRYAFSNATVQRAASTARYRFAVRSSGEVKNIKNTNDLLVVDPDTYVVGGKTGYLDESLYNLVVRLRYPPGRRGSRGDVIVAVLGSPTRTQSFKDAKALAEWAWQVHEWPQPVALTQR